MNPVQPRKCFTYNALVPAHIPRGLQDRLNETNGLWQFLLKPTDIQLFESCLEKLEQHACKDSTLLWVEEEYSDEYNSYRRCLGIIFNPPVAIYAHLNQLATGWKGDPYALVQRFKTVV